MLLLIRAVVKVEVEIIYEPRQFRLRVRDDGHGIDQKILKRVAVRIIGACRECANAPTRLAQN